MRPDDWYWWPLPGSGTWHAEQGCVFILVTEGQVQGGPRGRQGEGAELGAHLGTTEQRRKKKTTTTKKTTKPLSAL